MHRRRFIQSAGVAAAGIGLSNDSSDELAWADQKRVAMQVTNVRENGEARGKLEPAICVFTKPFNSLSFDELAESISKLGFDGIEAPIRKGGHVDLEKIEDQLPKLVSSLKQYGLQITLMTSDINSVDKRSERILRAAAANGVTRYRLQYFRYAENRPIKDQLKQWTKQLKELADLNRELGLEGLYQNHAGRRLFGASVWDLAQVIDEVDSPNLGVAYDIRHAIVEGGQSWPTTMRRIMPRVKMMYVKDFRWTEKGSIKNVPLGEGLVDSKFFKMAVSAGFEGPVSLHEEYLDHRDPNLVPSHLAAMKQDLAVLRGWMGL